jgi:hypothetical protein
VIVGAGQYRYELVEGWEQLPEGMSHPDVAAVRYCQDTGHIFDLGVAVVDERGRRAPRSAGGWSGTRRST